MYAEMEVKKFTFRELVGRTVSRPFKMLTLEPILVLVTVYLSVVYGVIYARKSITSVAR